MFSDRVIKMGLVNLWLDIISQAIRKKRPDGSTWYWGKVVVLPDHLSSTQFFCACLDDLSRAGVEWRLEE